MTATAAGSSPIRPPGPTRSRCRSLDRPNPVSSNPTTSLPPGTGDLNRPDRAAILTTPTPRWSTPHHPKASMQEAPMDRDDRTTDTGMLGSDAENPGPGRDTRRTDPYPAAAGDADDPETTTAMSDDDPDRTRLGSHQRGR